ncbi:MAG: hypothetical protein EA377_02745 [Phycisphaerales bacterium]|nr:MAG: hypothetical protein EA377_02745 [Phycisphaerales bacterium]
MTKEEATQVGRRHFPRVLDESGIPVGEETYRVWQDQLPELYPMAITLGSGRLERFGYRESMMGGQTPPFNSADGQSFIGIGLWTFSEIEAGWPLKSFRRSTRIPEESRDWFAQYNTFRQRVPTVLSADAEEFILPLRPIWTGFVTNSIFYGIVLLALIIVPRSLRRLIRVQRGQCPSCAYPIGVSNRCTECGTPIAPRRTGDQRK